MMCEGEQEGRATEQDAAAQAPSASLVRSYLLHGLKLDTHTAPPTRRPSPVWCTVLEILKKEKNA